MLYVDDTFVSFKSRSDALEFFDTLNQLHSSLSFTMEEESNGQLPFLDVLVERGDSSFLTSVYRKPTFTGLYLNWHSFAPKSRKLNLIRCLSYRALNICSERKIENELKAIKDIFIDNGYPGDVIDNNIKHAVTKFKDMNKVFGPLKCPVNFRIPWVGSATKSFANKIASSVYRCSHAVNLRPIFTSRPAFNSTNKNKLPIFKQSNLIYRFVCRCNSTYMGMTCQRLEVRVWQHIPRSLLSDRLTARHSQALDSAIGKHLPTINSCRTRYEDDCISVLHRARDKSHLKFLEAIYISMNHPSLCRQLNNHILNIFGKLLDTGVTYFFLFVVVVVLPLYQTSLIIYIYIYIPCF